MADKHFDPFRRIRPHLSDALREISTQRFGALLSPELTWQGHDLLDTLRSKALWERIKTTAKEKGIELTFDTVKALGKLALDYVLKQGE